MHFHLEMLFLICKSYKKTYVKDFEASNIEDTDEEASW